jgi:hypothetical protein
MDKKKIEEIKNLFNECKQLKSEVYTCHGELKTNYSVYKKQILRKMNKNSENTISDLKMVLAYLKKHNELKMIYDSYKELLREMLQYKKKILYFSHLSKPLISDKQLQILLKEQNDIIENVGKIDEILPQ